MDVARSIQEVCERVVLAQARHVRARTGERNLVLAGGVALNSVANGKLRAAGIFDDLWIQPAAGDAGGALGAALVAWHHVAGQPRTPVAPDGMAGAYLGPSPAPSDLAAALEAHGLQGTHLPDGAWVDPVADLLAEGKVVGVCRGAMEFGPRALGHRSILADPRTQQMQDRVNAKIKFREGFRPFAPAVRAEDASDWFELDGRSPYMLHVVPVAEARRLPQGEAAEGLARLKLARSQINAVTHVDGSARVQTVHADTSPDFHALLTAFDQRTGCPILLNTSFNLRGEPIVATPHDAVRTFLASGMDALLVGDTLVARPEGAVPTGKAPPPPDLSEPRSDSDLRTFGIGGAVLLTVAAILRGGHDDLTVSALLLGVGLVLGALGFFAPGALRPVEAFLSKLFKPVGHLVGRLLLTLVHLLVVTPLGWLRRTTGGDPLGLNDTSPPTWTPIEPPPQGDAQYDRMS